MEQIIRFQDEDAADSVDLSTKLNPLYSIDEHESASLGQYLSRPVRIATLTWSEGVPYYSTHKVWHDFLSSPYIKNKLENFSRLRCKLHLKFVVNTSQFYYGALRACYHPMQMGQHLVEENDRIHTSQLPGVWIEPQKMSSVEMVLPFLYTGQFVDITSSFRPKSLGTLEIIEYSPLRSANGVIGTGATLNIYAWASDVSLFAPTAEPALQSDEYEIKDGVVSRPATVVAQVAESLSDFPFIGPFARATGIGARAIAGIAGLFGFSNPPVISDVQPMRPNVFHAMANVETRTPLDKLSVDPKNEITIDNSVCDVSSIDPLSFKQTLGRESWMGRVTWDQTYSPNDRLMAVRVTPGTRRDTPTAQGTIRHYPPLAYFGKLFQFWRGSLIYKLKIIKSRYHKGRILISWDPQGGLSGSNPVETVVFSRVVDLETEDEVEIEIPYKAATPWLLCGDSSGFEFSKSGNFPLDTRFQNGMMTVRVLNNLTGPADLPQVDIHIFVRAGDDLKFSRPQELDSEHHSLPFRGDLELQSAEISISNGSSTTDARMDAVTVGETICSIRPILHRSSLGLIQPMGQSRSGDTLYEGPGTHFTYNVVDRVPRPSGWDPLGYNWATTGSNPATRYNFVTNHPVRWVINCFLGYRGSMNVLVNPIVASPETGYIDSLSISRHYGDSNRNPLRQNTNRGARTIAFHSDSSLSKIVTQDTNAIYTRATGQTGTSVTNTNTQSGLTVNVPQYSFARFYLSNYNYRQYIAIDGDLGSPTEFSSLVNYDDVVINGSFQTTSAGGASKPWPAIEVYYSAGVDFNPVFFLCTPRVYVYTTPTAVDSYAP